MTDALQNLLKQLRLSGLLSTLEVRLHGPPPIILTIASSWS